MDTQIRGPFRDWWHEHVFEHQDRVTLMIDRVHYRAPGRALGRVMEQLVLDAYLRDLIHRRNA